jgi:ABC-2 type transport system permease protein
VIYSFSLAVISQTQSNSQELFHASIGIVDEDHSELSRRIAHAFLMPYFKEPVAIGEADVEHLMNAGKFTFVIEYALEDDEVREALKDLHSHDKSN